METRPVPARVARGMRPARRPGILVRLGLMGAVVLVVLHCVVSLALLVQTSRFVLALAFAGATLNGHSEGGVLLRTGLFWVAITIVLGSAAMLVLRQRPAAIRSPCGGMSESGSAGLAGLRRAGSINGWV